MRSLIFCAVAIFLMVNARAQQYLVRYDVATEELQYFRIKKKDTIPVTMIYVSGSGRVNLQIVNVAGSYRQQVVMHEKIETPETILIPGLGGEGLTGMQSLFKTGGNIGVEDIFKELQGDNKATNLELSMAVTSFTRHYNRFNEQYAKWVSAIKQSGRLNQLWKELAVLRYTLQYDAATVKQKAVQQTKPVLPGLVNDSSMVFTGMSSLDAEAIFRQMTISFGSMKESYDKMTALDFSSPEADSLLGNVSRSINNAQLYAEKNPISEEALVTRIRELYKGIMADKYSQLISLPVTRKTEMAELQLFPRIDSVTAHAIAMPLSDTILRWMPIIKKEPMHFRNTFGFGFVGLPENRWHYYVGHDSTVARSSGDVFQPLIASYLHFYSMKDRGFRWGGSFGAGIPLSGENKQLNLMLGLSSFFGKNDPVCLTIGVAGARVKKLMELNIGDKLPSADAELKYDLVYRVGWFLSLSFNPSALNAR